MSKIKNLKTEQIIITVFLALFTVLSIVIICVGDNDTYDKSVNKHITYDAVGNNILETYYDKDGNQVALSSGYYATKREYNDKNQCIKVTYLDKDGNPDMTSLHYAGFYRTYNSNGKVSSDMYFDEIGNPTELLAGNYGLGYKYDSAGRKYIIIQLDKDGTMKENKAGYAYSKYTFNDDDSIDCEFYYDLDGNQVALASGQYGVKIVDGEEIYIDKDGNPYHVINDFFYKVPWIVILCGCVLVLLAIFMPERFKWFFLVLYIGFILYETLYGRDYGEGFNFELFWSYRKFFTNPDLRVEIVNNMWLFAPLGAWLYKYCAKFRYILIALVVSIIIETIQGVLDIGMFEFDDMVSNTFGAFAGALAARLYHLRDRHAN